MGEMGPCMGRCRDLTRCFFVRDYFMCRHRLCYNIVIKFRLCVICGNSELRYMLHTDNVEEVVLSHTILGGRGGLASIRTCSDLQVALQLACCGSDAAADTAPVRRG